MGGRISDLEPLGLGGLLGGAGLGHAVLSSGQLDLQAQVACAMGVDQRLVQADLPVPVKLEQDLIEGLAALLQALLHGLPEEVGLSLLDQVLDTGRIHEDLQRRDAFAVRGGDQPLGEDRPEIHRELEVDLRMPFRREEVHDPLDRPVRIVGVQRPHAEMARLRERDGGYHPFGIANLANRDNVRRLPQGVLQRHLVGMGIEADLALRDHGFLVTMDELKK